MNKYDLDNGVITIGPGYEPLRTQISDINEVTVAYNTQKFVDETIMLLDHVAENILKNAVQAEILVHATPGLVAAGPKEVRFDKKQLRKATHTLFRYKCIDTMLSGAVPVMWRSRRIDPSYIQHQARLDLTVCTYSLKEEQAIQDVQIHYQWKQHT